jgi:hypothetical protein
MAKAKRLPGRDTMLRLVKDVDVQREWQSSSDKLDELEREVKKLRAQLLADKRLRELERKVSAERSRIKRGNEAKRNRKRDLMNRLRLSEITPKLVADVKAFVGVKD